MGRLALRPALRAYAHAPAAAPVAAFTNTKSTKTDNVDDGWKVLGLSAAEVWTADGYTISCWIRFDDPVNQKLSPSSYKPIVGMGASTWGGNSTMTGIVQEYNYPLYSAAYDRWDVKFNLYETISANTAGGDTRVWHTSDIVPCMTGDTVGDGSGTALWLHVAATSTTAGYGTAQGTLKVYINGTVGSGADNQYSVSWGAQPFNMFGINYMGQVGNERFSGMQVDHVSYWTTALDQTGVNALMDGTAPADLSSHADEADLLLWYQIGEGEDVAGSGGSLTDTQGNYDLDAVGAPIFTTDIPT